MESNLTTKNRIINCGLRVVLIPLVLIFFSAINLRAQNCAFSDGGISYSKPGQTFNETTGRFSCGDYFYKYTVVQSGNFTIPDLKMTLSIQSGVIITLPPNINWQFASGTWPMTLSGTIPQTALCGQSCDITITWIQYEKPENSVTATLTVKAPLAKIEGSEALCPNTSGAYTLSDPGGISGNYTWSCNTAGWKINGNNSPISQTAATAYLYAPLLKGQTILTVSGGNLCQPVNYKVISTNLPAPVLTIFPNQICQGMQKTWSVNRIYGATVYNWSFMPAGSGANSSGIILSPANNICAIDGLSTGTYNISIKASNHCGVSSQVSKSVYVKAYTNSCGPRSLEIEQESKDEKIYWSDSSEGISVFPIPANTSVQIVTDKQNTFNEFKLIDVTGRSVLDKQLPEINSAISFEIPVGNLPAGIYFLLLSNENSRVTKKIIVSHE